MTNFAERTSYAGKSVLVTGAAGILGRALCRALLEGGARVVAIDCSDEALATLNLDLDSPRLSCFNVDLRDRERIVRFINDSIEYDSPIDVVFNNAASKSGDIRAFFSEWSSYPGQIWDEVIQVNLNAVFTVTATVADQMRRNNRSGAIINVGSIYGLVGPDPELYAGSFYLGGPINTPPVYAASKGGILALTRYFATILGPYNIRVNSITPGGVASGQNDTFARRYADRTPLGRMAEVTEIIDAMLFLGSSAASYITGHNLVVDGGFTVR